MRPKYIMWMVVIIAVTLAMFYAGYASVLNTKGSSTTVVKTNTKVKTFSTETIDSKPYTFEQTHDVIMVEGFAEWCLPCRKSVPQAIKFAKRHPEIKVIGVAYRDVKFKTLEFQKEFGKFETTIESNGKIEQALGLTGIPQTLFIVDGKVTYRIYGSSTLADLEKVLSLVKVELARS